MNQDWKDDAFFEGLAAQGGKLGEALDRELELLGVVREARLKAWLRGLVFVVALILCSMLIKANFNDLDYFLRRAQPVTDLGNLRDPAFQPSQIRDLSTNTLVAFQNDVITMDNIRTTNHEYYFSPVTSCIVRTPSTLPDKTVHETLTVELDSWESRLVLDKKAFPADLKVSFQGQGRYISPADIPTWLQPLQKYFSEGTTFEAFHVCAILDGDQPQKHWPALLMVLGSLAVIFFTGFVFARAFMLFLTRKKGRRT